MPPSFSRAFALGLALNLGFVVLEVTFGLLSGSMALLADAGHNLGDVLGLALAWGATLLAARAPTPRRTYGWSRATLLAALANSMLLLVATGGILWEALERLSSPPPVEGWTVIGVAAAGVVVNGVSALLFMKGSQDDLNVRGAFLHLAADAGVSLAVVVGGVVMLQTGLSWIDPILALLVSAVIVGGTWSLLRQSVDLMLDAVPDHIDPQEVRAYLMGLPGVTQVHDLHIWAMSTTHIALTAHLVMQEGWAPDRALIPQASADLRRRFGIGHPTLQIEYAGAHHRCQVAEDHPG